MKKTLLLSAALLLGTYTSLFAQVLAESQFTVKKTYDVGTQTELTFLGISEQDKFLKVDIDFTYNGAPDAIEFFVVIQEKASGTYKFLEGYAQTVTPSPDPQTLSFFFEVDGKLQDTQTDYPTGTWPLEVTPENGTSVYTTIVTCQAKGVGGASQFLGANTRWIQTLVIAGQTRPLGITDFDLVNGFEIYPNPVKSQFRVNLPQEVGTLNIVSLTGKVLMTQKTSGLTEMNLENLSSGMYLCHYTNDKGTKTVKLIKE